MVTNPHKIKLSTSNLSIIQIIAQNIMMEILVLINLNNQIQQIQFMLIETKFLTQVLVKIFTMLQSMIFKVKNN